jgi:hypothetical protein
MRCRGRRSGGGYPETFLYAVTRQVGFTEVMALHKAACRRTGDITKPCVIFLPPDPVTGDERIDAGDPMSWVDGLLGGDIDPTTGQAINQRQHGGFLSGAKRKYGETDPKVGDVEADGLAHGVDQNTSP